MFKIIQPEDQVISSDSITGTVWSNNNPTLSNFFTSSIQVAGNTGKFYFHVYQVASTDAAAAVQFDIAYADEFGSGSLFYNPLVTGSSPSRTIYGQYQNLVLSDDTEKFIFGGVTSSHFYSIAPDRARFKEVMGTGSADRFKKYMIMHAAVQRANELANGNDGESEASKFLNNHLGYKNVTFW